MPSDPEVWTRVHDLHACCSCLYGSPKLGCSMNSSLSPKTPSERRFGLTLAALFFALSTRNLIEGHSAIAYGAWLMISALLGILALVVPRSLAPLNKAWFHFGQLLGKIVSPVVLGIIFFALLTPIALITRLFGRDELRLNRGSRTSYWIERIQPTHLSNTFKNPY